MYQNIIFFVAVNMRTYSLYAIKMKVLHPKLCHFHRICWNCHIGSVCEVDVQQQ